MPPNESLLAALILQNGSNVQLELNAKKDAIIVRPVVNTSKVRGKHKIEERVAAMPKNFKSAEFKSLDYRSRGMKRIERSPQKGLDEGLALIDASIF